MVEKRVLEKIEEYALLKYGISTSKELDDIILAEGRQTLVDEYLDAVKLRIMRKKADEAKAYVPTDKELIDKLQGHIDAANPTL